MLSFAAADLEEGQGNLAAAKEMYESLVAPTEQQPAATAGEGGEAEDPPPPGTVAEVRIARGSCPCP
jgi:hypothetical protein